MTSDEAIQKALDRFRQRRTERRIADELNQRGWWDGFGPGGLYPDAQNLQGNWGIPSSTKFGEDGDVKGGT